MEEEPQTNQQHTNSETNPMVSQTTTVQETLGSTPDVTPTTTLQETLDSTPMGQQSMVEETVEKIVEKPVEVISRRNNQSNSQAVMVYNPSLRLIPRHEPADVIYTQQDSSLVEWLETSGRMLPRDPSEIDNFLEGDEDISELIVGDDNFSDDDDDVLDEEAEEIVE